MPVKGKYYANQDFRREVFQKHLRRAKAMGVDTLELQAQDVIDMLKAEDVVDVRLISEYQGFKTSKLLTCGAAFSPIRKDEFFNILKNASDQRLTVVTYPTQFDRLSEMQFVCQNELLDMSTYKSCDMPNGDKVQMLRLETFYYWLGRNRPLSVTCTFCEPITNLDPRPEEINIGKFDPAKADVKPLENFFNGMKKFISKTHTQDLLLTLVASEFKDYFDAFGKMIFNAGEDSFVDMNKISEENFKKAFSEPPQPDPSFKTSLFPIGISKEQYDNLTNKQKGKYHDWYKLADCVGMFEGGFPEELLENKIKEIIVFGLEQIGLSSEQVSKLMAEQTVNGNPSTFGGAKFTKTDKTVTILGRKRTVYVGARNKQFVKVKGDFVALSDLKRRESKPTPEKRQESKKKAAQKPKAPKKA